MGELAPYLNIAWLDLGVRVISIRIRLRLPKGVDLPPDLYLVCHIANLDQPFAQSDLNNGGKVPANLERRRVRVHNKDCEESHGNLR